MRLLTHLFFNIIFKREVANLCRFEACRESFFPDIKSVLIFGNSGIHKNGCISGLQITKMNVSESRWHTATHCSTLQHTSNYQDEWLWITVQMKHWSKLSGQRSLPQQSSLVHKWKRLPLDKNVSLSEHCAIGTFPAINFQWRMLREIWACGTAHMKHVHASLNLNKQ